MTDSSNDSNSLIKRMKIKMQQKFNIITIIEYALLTKYENDIRFT